MNTGLGSILTEAQIITNLRATNRWEAIDELTNQLVTTGSFESEHLDAITALVRKRESCTGIGFGIGIPHASTDLISAAVAALGRSQRGIEFDALDGQPVKLVVLFLIPQGHFQKHLHILAEIAKLLHKPNLRQALEQAPGAASLLQIIKGQNASRSLPDESV